jgi:DNA processing protein
MSGLDQWVALSLLPLSCRRDSGERFRAGESPDAYLEAVLASRPAATIGRETLLSRTRRAIDRGASIGIRPVVWTDDEYPPALAAIVDPPPVLWLRGAPAALERPSVAIVGSRAGTPYALAVAERLAADLAARGLTVVSGLARGVDSAAHRGALQAGTTVAVLGSGVDVIYPSEHAGLARQIAQAGALLSELAPGTAPHKSFFPMRNRLISGLSRGVVVVEAGTKSGSLITARMALDQGREVLAVPGSVLGGRNRGGHALIRDGAKIVETADDIFEELGLGPSPVHTTGGRHACAPHDPVLGSLIPGEACDLDAIASRSGLPVEKLLPRLLDLELRGLIRRAGGGRFVRFDTSC